MDPHLVTNLPRRLRRLATEHGEQVWATDEGDAYLGGAIHHKDGDFTNNRLDNLEITPRRQPAGAQRGEKTMQRTQSPYYSISDERLAAVVALVQASNPKRTTLEAQGFMLTDWPEGREHQLWLDTAPLAEIADWVIAGFA